MGEILSTRVAPNGKVIFEVAMPYNEALRIGGRLDKVHLFTEAQMKLKSRIIRRGKNEATTYLLVPKKLRTILPVAETNRPTKVLMTEAGDKIFLIFSLEKTASFSGKEKKGD